MSGSADGRGAGSGDTRRRLAGATAVWVAVHLLLGLLHLGDHGSPALDLAAMVLVVLMTATVLLVGPWSGRWGTALTAALAAAVITTALLVSPFLAADRVTGYGLWWPGAVGPVLAALALRGRGPAAVATAAALCGLTWWVVARAGLHPWQAGVTTLRLTGPPVLWTLAGLGVRLLLDRADTSLREIEDATRAAVLRHSTAADGLLWAHASDAVVVGLGAPALREIGALGDADQVTGAQREHWSATAHALRDELAGRALLDDEGRTAVREARARGVDIRIEDMSPAAGMASAQVRALVTAAAGVVRAGTLTLRRPPEGGAELTVVLSAHPAEVRRWAAAVGGAQTLRACGLDPDEVVLDVDPTAAHLELPGRPARVAGARAARVIP